MPIETQFYLSAIDHLKDPSRKTRWRMILPASIIKQTNYKGSGGNNKLFIAADDDGDDFALHVKTCRIPEITLTQAPHNYMGFKSNFVTNAKIDADFDFQTILLEDAWAYEAILAWHQACLNTGLLRGARNTNTGDGQELFTSQSGVALGLGYHKDDVTKLITRNSKVRIEMYNWFTGKIILTVTLINAVPTSVGGWEMNYEEAGGLNYFTFKLHADRWNVQITDNGGNDSNTL